MQLPVAHAGDDRLTRQLGAVHKEQQRDGGGGQVLKEGFPDAFAGEQRGDDHHQNQNQQKFINAQTLQPGHETDFLARKVVKRPDVAPGHWRNGRYQATGSACCSRADSSPSSINAITAMASAAGTGFSAMPAMASRTAA